MCDRQQECINKCACYQMTSRSGNVLLSVEVKATLPDGSSFKTFIRSKSFLEILF